MSLQDLQRKKSKIRKRPKSRILRATLTTPSKKEIAHQRGEPSYQHNEDVLFAPPRSHVHHTPLTDASSPPALAQSLWSRIAQTLSNPFPFFTENKVPDREYSPFEYPRIVERGSEGRPAGRIFVRKRMKKKDWYARYGFDWFHSLMNISTMRLIILMMILYLGIVLIFAIMYYQIHLNYFCDLDFNTFVGAFDFTLETMATIGYGTKNIYFDDCWSVSAVLAFQMCVRLILDAFVIGVIYSKLARPHARASTVIFSNHAVIRRVRGQLFFMFQLCELRKHQLAEAHVRLYVVKREVDPSSLASSSSSLREPARDGETFAADEAQPLLGHTRRHSLQFGEKHQPAHKTQHHRSNSMASHPPIVPSYSSVPIEKPHLAQHGSHKPPPTFLQTSIMRLTHPNDELGAPLLLMLPQLIVHELDAVSPLMPPPLWTSVSDNQSVRWQPPAYRAFEEEEEKSAPAKTADTLRTPRASSSAQGVGEGVHHPVPGEEKDIHPVSPTMRGYNAAALSAMSFPRVIRRAQDYRTLMKPNVTETSSYLEESKQRSDSWVGPIESPSVDLAVTPSLTLSLPVEESGRATERDVSELVSPGLQQYAQDMSQQSDLLDNENARNRARTISRDFLESRSEREKEIPSDSQKRQRTTFNENNEDDLEPDWQRDERAMIQRYLLDRQVEIIAVVEGIDTSTGGIVQARHSFVFKEIEWDKRFQHCVYQDPDDFYATVDFDLFHELVDAPKDAAYAGPIHSCI